MIVAGASLSSLLQQQKGYATPQTKKQEQSTIQSLHGNFAKRSTSQHSDQENQCLRASSGKCKNAVLSEQTLGNDNSVTGFADQSKNTQAAVVTPTPTSIPTLPLTTPCPPGTLFGVTLQAPLGTLPKGTQLCLTSVALGIPQTITAILPSGSTQIVTVVLTELNFPPDGPCAHPGSVSALADASTQVCVTFHL